MKQQRISGIYDCEFRNNRAKGDRPRSWSWDTRRNRPGRVRIINVALTQGASHEQASEASAVQA